MSDYDSDYWDYSGDEYPAVFGSRYGSGGGWVEGEDHRSDDGSDDDGGDGVGGGHASGGGDGYGRLTDQYKNPNAALSYGYSKSSSDSQQVTYKSNSYDKLSGSYSRATVRESVSTGDVFKERSTGRVGYKDEFKTTSTYKFGDKSGFTEYQREERLRHVDFGGAVGGGSTGSSISKGGDSSSSSISKG